jgi:hypothetical protein
LRITQADHGAAARDVVDRLSTLADDLADAPVPERLEQLAVEGEAALERGDDEVEVVDAAAGQRALPSSSCQRR